MTEHTPDPLADIGDRLDALERALSRLAERLDQPARRWLSAEDAAAYAGVSLRTMRTIIAAGRLQIHRPSPHRVTIDVRELDAYVAGTTARARYGVRQRADAARRRAGA